jgi:hypothetical protein
MKILNVDRVFMAALVVLSVCGSSTVLANGSSEGSVAGQTRQVTTNTDRKGAAQRLKASYEVVKTKKLAAGCSSQSTCK